MNVHVPLNQLLALYYIEEQRFSEILANITVATFRVNESGGCQGTVT